MTYLFLVRHGESDQNVGVNEIERLPDHAIELTAEGHKQASRAGLFLREWLQGVPTEDKMMWVSPYRRTRQTAENIKCACTFGKIYEDDLLTEMQFGIFDAINKKKLPEIFPREWAEYSRVRQYNGKFYARRPGGESPFDCEIRQKLFIDTLFRDINSGKCPHYIVIVGHGAALTLFRKAMFHYSHEWFAEEPNPGNCSIQMIKLNDGYNEDEGYIYGHAEVD